MKVKEKIRVINLIGYRMPQPEECPAEVYKLMLLCWNTSPEDRPNFGQILEQIEGIQKPSTKVEEVLKLEQIVSQEILYN